MYHKYVYASLAHIQRRLVSVQKDGYHLLCIYMYWKYVYVSLAHIQWFLIPLQKDGYHHIVYICIINMSMHRLLTSDGPVSHYTKMENTAYFVYICIYMYWIHVYASFAHIWWPFVTAEKRITPPIVFTHTHVHTYTRIHVLVCIYV